MVNKIRWCFRHRNSFALDGINCPFRNKNLRGNTAFSSITPSWMTATFISITLSIIHIYIRLPLLCILATTDHMPHIPTVVTITCKSSHSNPISLLRLVIDSKVYRSICIDQKWAKSPSFLPKMLTSIFPGTPMPLGTSKRILGSQKSKPRSQKRPNIFIGILLILWGKIR